MMCKGVRPVGESRGSAGATCRLDWKTERLGNLDVLANILGSRSAFAKLWLLRHAFTRPHLCSSCAGDEAKAAQEAAAAQKVAADLQAEPLSPSTHPTWHLPGKGGAVAGLQVALASWQPDVACKDETGSDGEKLKPRQKVAALSP